MDTKLKFCIDIKPAGYIQLFMQAPDLPPGVCWHPGMLLGESALEAIEVDYVIRTPSGVSVAMKLQDECRQVFIASEAVSLANELVDEGWTIDLEISDCELLPRQ